MLHKPLSTQKSSQKQSYQSSLETKEYLKENQIFDRMQYIVNENEKAYSDTKDQLKGKVPQLFQIIKTEGQIQQQLRLIREQIQDAKIDLNDIEQMYHGSPINSTPDKKNKIIIQNIQNEYSPSFKFRSPQSNKSFESVRESFDFTHFYRQKPITATPTTKATENKRYSEIHLYCMFTRLQTSIYVRLRGPNSLTLKAQDKMGALHTTKSITTINSILTSRNEIPCDNANYMVVGSKSSEKSAIIKNIVQGLVDQHAHNGAVEVFATVFCTAPKLMPFLQMQQSYYTSSSPTDLWYQMQRDPYYQIKKLLRTQLKVSQCCDERKEIMCILQGMYCLKVICIQTANSINYVVASNGIPQSKNNWLAEAFLIVDQQKPVLSGGVGAQLQQEAYDCLCSDPNRRVILTINPLRYRLSECLKTLNLLKEFEKN